MDSLLNRDETLAFLATLVGEELKMPPLFKERVQSAVASLNTQAGDSVTFEEFFKTETILLTWMKSKKGINAAMANMPPEAKAMMKGAAKMM